MIKKVGQSYYTHKSNLNELLCNLSNDEKIFVQKIISHNKDLYKNCCIVKFNRIAKTVSFIECADWDTANEPLVGNSYCFHSPTNYKTIKGGTKIYHNKWQFVSDNYHGFDVLKAKKRTALWNKIPDITQKKKFIGSKAYWLQLLNENNIEP